MERKGEIPCSRWKPTKRQKEILEELFKEGHRNPSRSQINEFTSKLKRHGNVEEKNVFYWFQNTHARNKGKQKKETRGMHQSPFESTPLTLHEKASGIIVDSSMGMPQFSKQGHTNSPESVASTSTEKLQVPIDLSMKQHLQSVANDTFSESDRRIRFEGAWNRAAVRNDRSVHHITDPRRSNVMISSDGQEYERKHELLELFPLHPDEDLRSKYSSGSFRRHRETNSIQREHGEWLSLKFVP